MIRFFAIVWVVCACTLSRAVTIELGFYTLPPLSQEAGRGVVEISVDPGNGMFRLSDLDISFAFNLGSKAVFTEMDIINTDLNRVFVSISGNGLSRRLLFTGDPGPLGIGGSLELTNGDNTSLSFAPLEVGPFYRLGFEDILGNFPLLSVGTYSPIRRAQLSDMPATFPLLLLGFGLLASVALPGRFA